MPNGYGYCAAQMLHLFTLYFYVCYYTYNQTPSIEPKTYIRKEEAILDHHFDSRNFTT